MLLDGSEYPSPTHSQNGQQPAVSNKPPTSSTEEVAEPEDLEFGPRLGCTGYFPTKGWIIKWERPNLLSFANLVTIWLAIYAEPKTIQIPLGKKWLCINGHNFPEAKIVLLIGPVKASKTTTSFVLDAAGIRDQLLRLVHETTKGGSFIYKGMEIALRPKWEFQDRKWMFRCYYREMNRDMMKDKYGADSEHAVLEPCTNPSCKFHESE